MQSNSNNKLIDNNNNKILGDELIQPIDTEWWETTDTKSPEQKRILDTFIQMSVIRIPTLLREDVIFSEPEQEQISIFKKRPLPIESVENNVIDKNENKRPTLEVVLREELQTQEKRTLRDLGILNLKSEEEIHQDIHTIEIEIDELKKEQKQQPQGDDYLDPEFEESKRILDELEKEKIEIELVTSVLRKINKNPELLDLLPVLYPKTPDLEEIINEGPNKAQLALQYQTNKFLSKQYSVKEDPNEVVELFLKNFEGLTFETLTTYFQNIKQTLNPCILQQYLTSDENIIIGDKNIKMSKYYKKITLYEVLRTLKVERLNRCISESIKSIYKKLQPNSDTDLCVKNSSTNGPSFTDNLSIIYSSLHNYKRSPFYESSVDKEPTYISLPFNFNNPSLTLDSIYNYEEFWLEALFIYNHESIHHKDYEYLHLEWTDIRNKVLLEASAIEQEQLILLKMFEKFNIPKQTLLEVARNFHNKRIENLESKKPGPYTHAITQVLPFIGQYGYETFKKRIFARTEDLFRQIGPRLFTLEDLIAFHKGCKVPRIIDNNS